MLFAPRNSFRLLRGYAATSSSHLLSQATRHAFRESSAGSCLVDRPGGLESLGRGERIVRALHSTRILCKASKKPPPPKPRMTETPTVSLDEATTRRLAANFSKWEKTVNVPIELEPNETEVTVMSYNILAQYNLDSHPKLYERCNPDHLLWSYRRSRLISEILGRKCDILCLQEVQDEHLLEDLVPAFGRKGYNYVFKGKTGGKNEGCAIFWKQASFNLLNYQPVEMMVPDCRVLNRDNVGLVLVFGAKNDPRTKFCVATTHLLFNTQRGEVKLAQIRYLLAVIESVTYLGTSPDGRRQYMPILLTGDWNALPKSPLYEFVSEGSLQWSQMKHSRISGHTGGFRVLMRDEVEVGDLLPCSIFDQVYRDRGGCTEADDKLVRAYNEERIYHPFGKFKSPYTHEKRSQAEVSNYADEPVTTDYIFYQQSKLIRCVARLGLMTKDELDRLGGLPNAALGSDHLPVAARFFLKPIPGKL